MPEEPEKTRRDWHTPDEFREHVVPLLPSRKPQPLGCHRPRIKDRKAMDAMFFVRRTGCQWNALRETSLCSSSVAHHRFQKGTAAGIFLALCKNDLMAYDALTGIHWAWLAMDGAVTKVPSGGKT